MAGIEVIHPTKEEIRARAYEIYLQRLNKRQEIEDWLAAEAELKQKQARANRPPFKAKIVAAL